MEIVLVLVRHGQASHNSGSEMIFDYFQEGEKQILDTDLTQTGREQAQQVAVVNQGDKQDRADV